MKKVLFCAAVVALAAACTEDELGTSQVNSPVQEGLYFDVSLAEGATTRGELNRDENGTYPFFWYAEQDEINVAGINVEAVTADYGNNTGNYGIASQSSGAWTLPSMFATYKATRSEGTGYFTAKDGYSMLALKDYDSKNAAETTATLVATYGDVKTSAVTSNLDSKGGAIPGSLKTLELTTTKSNAEQNLERANQVNAPMWSVSSAVKEAAYESLGEKANLRLIRPSPVVRFTTKNTNDYKDYFGNLVSVELKTMKLGSDGKTYEAGSSIAYDADKKYTVIGAETGFEDGYAPAQNANIVKVTYNTSAGTPWTDDDVVYMNVAPVDRDGKKEMLVITYNFANISFTLDGTQKEAKDFEILETSNDWTAEDASGNPNAVTALPALDVENYDYLVVGKSSPYTLIVNRGTMGDLIKGTNVIWPITGTSSNIALTDVKNIIVNCDLEDADYANLNKFTSVKTLKLMEETSLPAGALKAFAASTESDKELVMPKVTSIDDKFIGDETELGDVKVLNTESYAYAESETVNSLMFEGLETYLEEVNIKAVADMTPIFGQPDANLSFQNYTALKKATVSEDGLVLRSNSFSGCSALEEVDGKVNPTEGYNAFQDASILETVNVTTTEFPNSIFYGAEALKNVLYNGAQVAPTVVGANAFRETAVEYMDLSKVTSIGESAFRDVAELKGPAKGNSELHVGGTVVPANLFNGCSALTIVQFDSATSFDVKILAGATSIRQIKFAQPFTVEAKLEGATGWTQDMFGAKDNSALVTNVTLFISSEQNMSYFDGTVLKLPQVDAKGNPTVTKDYTFKDVVKQ